MPETVNPHGLALARHLLAVSFRKASALWIFAGLFVLFAIWVPDTFLTTNVWRTLLGEQAITALVAVGLVLPLAAGAFDLAVGTEVGLGSILVAKFLTKSMPIVPAVALAVLGGVLIGLVSGWLIVKVRIDSFIATLGVSSVLLALISWISDNQQIVGLSSAFGNLGNTDIFGVILPVYLLVALALIVYYVLEHTALGRRIYATGGNPDAARLAGIKTSWIVVGCLAGGAALAAFAGVLETSTLASSDNTIGPPYLLPAFSAVFLGSTQFRGGRFNVWGTVIAVYVLATGVKGLQLAGAPVWIPDAFNGVALLVAVGMANHERTGGRTSAIRRALRMDRRPGPDSVADAESENDHRAPQVTDSSLHGVTATSGVGVAASHRAEVAER